MFARWLAFVLPSAQFACLCEFPVQPYNASAFGSPLDNTVVVVAKLELLVFVCASLVKKFTFIRAGQHERQLRRDWAYFEPMRACPDRSSSGQVPKLLLISIQLCPL